MNSIGMPKNALCNAATIARKFFDVANAKRPRHAEAGLTIEWFEKRMRKLAENHGLHCQNKQHHSEWMNVDHVFVPSEAYTDFPLIAVEHENGDLSKESKFDKVPHGKTRGAFIEWAAWKALTMQAKLHVLVAYPWEKNRNSALLVLKKMVQGYRSTFGAVPNALFLLGW